METLLCPRHKLSYSLYCHTDNEPMCLKCIEKQDDFTEEAMRERAKNEGLKPDDLLIGGQQHYEHTYKSLKQTLIEADRQKYELEKNLGESLGRIATASNYFTGVKGMFMKQKEEYLKKLDADFDLILAMIERKRTDL